MGRNYVVLRRTPHWPSFDIQDTRAFLRNVGLPDNLIIDFAARWDSVMAVDYLGYREAMKTIALETAQEVRDAAVISYESLPALDIADDDLLYFTDDDDWVSPEIFAKMRAAGFTGEGWRWRSVFVGRMFVDTPLQSAGGPVVQLRTTTDILYTNNYAASGAAWNRLGAEALLEHGHAQRVFDSEEFRPQLLPDYLSAANKHLCSTVAIQFNNGSASLNADLRAALAAIVIDGAAHAFDEQAAWVRKPFQGFVNASRRALG